MRTPHDDPSLLQRYDHLDTRRIAIPSSMLPIVSDTEIILHKYTLSWCFFIVVFIYFFHIPHYSFPPCPQPYSINDCDHSHHFPGRVDSNIVQAQVGAILLLVCWIGFLFVNLAMVVDIRIVPNLETISKTLGKVSSWCYINYVLWTSSHMAIALIGLW